MSMTTTEKPIKELIAWCAECETWTPYSGPGECAMMYCETPGGRPTRIRKRRAYICYYGSNVFHGNRCMWASFTLEEHESHEHHQG